MEWMFEGIGTEIVSLLIGLVAGGTVGYKFGINNNSSKQKQRAGDNSTQIQIGRDSNGK